MEGANSKITMFAHYQECPSNHEKKLINLTKLGQITDLNMNFYNGGVSLSISLNLNSPQFPTQLRNGE